MVLVKALCGKEGVGDEIHHAEEDEKDFEYDGANADPLLVALLFGNCIRRNRNAPNATGTAETQTNPLILTNPTTNPITKPN